MKEGEVQDNRTLFEIMKDDPHITYREAEKLREGVRLRNEASAAVVKKAGTCMTAAMREDRGELDLTLQIDNLKEKYKIKNPRLMAPLIAKFPRRAITPKGAPTNIKTMLAMGIENFLFSSTKYLFFLFV